MSIESFQSFHYNQTAWKEKTGALKTEGAVVCGAPNEIAEIILEYKLPAIITDWGLDKDDEPMVAVDIFGKIPQTSLIALGHFGREDAGSLGNGVESSQMPTLIGEIMQKNQNLPIDGSLKQYAVSPFQFDSNGAVSPTLSGQAIYLHQNDRQVFHQTSRAITNLREKANKDDPEATEAVEALYPHQANALSALLLNQLRGVVLGLSSSTPNAALMGSKLHLMVPQTYLTGNTTVKTERYYAALGYKDVSSTFHKLHFEQANILKKIIMASIMHLSGNDVVSSEMFREIAKLNPTMRDREMAGGTRFPKDSFITLILQMNQRNQEFRQLQTTDLNPVVDPLDLVSKHNTGVAEILLNQVT